MLSAVEASLLATATPMTRVTPRRRSLVGSSPFVHYPKGECHSAKAESCWLLTVFIAILIIA